MQRISFADKNCSVAQALEVVGEWWTLMIVRDALLGVTRFDQFRQRLGISRNVLTTRLDALVAHGILERRAYDEGRDRHDYVLTPKGRGLVTVLCALREWGDEWILGTGNEPIQVLHRDCGGDVRTHLACDRCGHDVTLAELRCAPGPGLTDPDLLPRR
ncbi:MAG: helix-turn-helix transcriptional regulator [Actinobacteria bacterium]|nr:helix-turn-helix transcriptional regulator [Actinomycetota bacterium]